MNLNLEEMIKNIIAIGLDNIIATLNYEEVSKELDAIMSADTFLISEGSSVKFNLKTAGSIDIPAFALMQSTGVIAFYALLSITIEKVYETLLKKELSQGDAKDIAREIVVGLFHVASTKYDEMVLKGEIAKESILDKFLTTLISCGIFKDTRNVDLTNAIIKGFGKAYLVEEGNEEDN